MSAESKILVVDDRIGDITWLLDLVESLGYSVDQATNEESARRRIKLVAEHQVSYVLAIIDIMVSVKDIMDLVKLDRGFYEESRNTGIRLCRYAREELKISDETLPIVCISARSDDADIVQTLDELGICIFGRTPQGTGRSIREYLKERLPRIE